MFALRCLHALFELSHTDLTADLIADLTDG